MTTVDLSKYQDLTGYIFQHAGGFWKVTGLPRQGVGSYAVYPSIKCSKYGKEFRSSTGFVADYLLGKFERNEMRLCSLPEDQRLASTNGFESGIRKRRIADLSRELPQLVAELNKLLHEEGMPAEYKLLTSK